MKKDKEAFTFHESTKHSLSYYSHSTSVHLPNVRVNRYFLSQKSKYLLTPTLPKGGVSGFLRDRSIKARDLTLNTAAPSGLEPLPSEYEAVAQTTWLQHNVYLKLSIIHGQNWPTLKHFIIIHHPSLPFPTTHFPLNNMFRHLELIHEWI